MGRRDEVDEVLGGLANAMVVTANAWPTLPGPNRRRAILALVDLMLAVSGDDAPSAKVLRLVPDGVKQ